MTSTRRQTVIYVLFVFICPFRHFKLTQYQYVTQDNDCIRQTVIEGQRILTHAESLVSTDFTFSASFILNIPLS